VAERSAIELSQNENEKSNNNKKRLI